jgi:hydroxymethylglutaryl-CoA reductase
MTLDVAKFPTWSVEERVAALVAAGRITRDEGRTLLASGGGALGLDRANAMIENVVGILEVPVGLGVHFHINGEDRLVPMAVEEPSVVAAASHVARIVREAGGYHAESTDPVMIAQLQLLGVADPAAAKRALDARAGEILAAANALQPNLEKRGGGAREVEARILADDRPAADPRFKALVVVHLYVDCRDAMGANLLNTMAEGVSPLVEEITGGRVLLRILSNLADRRLARATVRIPAAQLAFKSFTGARVVDGVVEASRFAELDPYRAATHNKGIMNAIDAVCMATGNDWRAQEAGAHAFAARDGRYGPLAVWRKDAGGALLGRIELPVQVGVVGAQIQAHPVVRILHKILGVKNAADLGQVIASAGLGQNLAALKALSTEGIQAGHMSRHARAVAASAGVPAELVDDVAEELIASREIKVWKAQEILQSLLERQRA